MRDPHRMRGLYPGATPPGGEGPSGGERDHDLDLDGYRIRGIRV